MVRGLSPDEEDAGDLLPEEVAAAAVGVGAVVVGLRGWGGVSM